MSPRRDVVINKPESHLFPTSQLGSGEPFEPEPSLARFPHFFFGRSPEYKSCLAAPPQYKQTLPVLPRHRSNPRSLALMGSKSLCRRHDRRLAFLTLVRRSNSEPCYGIVCLQAVSPFPGLARMPSEKSASGVRPNMQLARPSRALVCPGSPSRNCEWSPSGRDPQINGPP